MVNGPRTGALLNSPQDLVFESSGNLYFTDKNNHRIRMMTSAGQISTVVGNGYSLTKDAPVASAELYHPTGLLRQGDGSWIFAELGGRLRQLK